MDFDKNLIEEHIIWKLFYQGRFGKGHFTEETMLKGLPRNLWGLAREKLKELIKKKIILYMSHDHGGAYYLNIETKYKWQEIIDKKLNEFGLI
jgi:hypothetical protein